VSRILVAEDDPGIASFIVKGLTAAGHTATVAPDGETALTGGRSDAFDLIVLDLGLPKRDGLSVLHELRSRGVQIPVIILTARESVDDLVGGLDAGADDYMVKPFRFDELLARIRSRLRADHVPRATRLQHGPVTLDLLTRRAQRAGIDIDLSAREFLLAQTFLEHPGQVLSRQQLLSRIWGYDFEGGSNVVDVYVGYLRRKLGSGFVVTMRGAGYRLGDTGA
jgi:DNA-binding response OmpR family regulator